MFNLITFDQIIDIGFYKFIEKFKYSSKSQYKYNLMLTGGRTAQLLYENWAKKINSHRDLFNINIYFSDERCVDPEDQNSNFNLLKYTLLKNINTNFINIVRMKGEKANKEAASDEYSMILPIEIDLIILTLGEDGHIASLFPYSNSLLEKNKLIVPSYSVNFPHNRLTITPVVINRAKNIAVLAYGDNKKEIFRKVFCNQDNFNECPARLLINRTWIL
jgi:6-phosphogluconolactonase